MFGFSLIIYFSQLKNRYKTKRERERKKARKKNTFYFFNKVNNCCLASFDAEFGSLLQKRKHKLNRNENNIFIYGAF